MRTVLPLGALLLSFALHAQTHYSSDSIIQLDMINPTEFPKDFTIKKNTTIRYKLTNFNRNLYTVNINSTASSLFTDKPAIFNLVTKIDVDKLSTAIAKGATGSETAAVNPEGEKLQKLKPESKPVREDYVKDREAFLQAITDFDNSYKKMKKIVEYLNHLNELFKDAVRPYSSLCEDKLTTTYKLLNTQFSYTGAITERELRLSLESNINALFADLEGQYDATIKAYTTYKISFVAYQSLYNQTIAEKTEEKKTLETKIKEAEEKTKGKKTDITNNKKDVDSLNVVKRDLDDLNRELAFQTATNGMAADNLDDVKTANTKIETLKQNGFMGNVFTAFAKISPTFFEYISGPIKGTKDLLDVKIDIQPKDVSFSNANYSQFNGNFTGTVTGFKINFSTGIFGLMGKNMFDQTYHLDPIAGHPDSNMIKKNDNKNWITPAFGGLMHFYYRNPGWFNWGGNVGMSISGDTHVNFHAGLSLIFGDEQRIILNAGLTLAQAKLITDQYKEDQWIPKTVTQVPTQGFFRGGWFLALTYNLSN